MKTLQKFRKTSEKKVGTYYETLKKKIPIPLNNFLENSKIFQQNQYNIFFNIHELGEL